MVASESGFLALDEIDADERKFRVFISYHHSPDDTRLAELAASVVEKLGHTALRDTTALTGGDDFAKKLQRYIASAHFMVVVATPDSVASAWMQQEIGYALAHRVPFIPIMVGAEPPGMLSSYHGVSIQPDWPREAMREAISKELDKVLKAGRPQEKTEEALYRCALQPEERGAMMTDFARDIRDAGHHARIRQFGGLSSFHIPLHPLEHPVWAARYYPKTRTEYYLQRQRAERKAFDVHARVAGCRLIIDPQFKPEQADFDESAWRVRLRCLIEFLESMPDSHCQVAINREQTSPESHTLAGTWFYCSSFSTASTGNYRQTIFTRHAPTVASEVQRFDEKFRYFLGDTVPEESRRTAIAELGTIVSGLHG